MTAATSHGRRVTVLLLAFFLVGILVPLALAACGADGDPFAGLYWEPTTGRRVEIRRDGDAYKLYYGRDQRAHVARLDGDQLVITDPMGGRSIVRPGVGAGTLELVTGGETTELKPLPQHQ